MKNAPTLEMLLLLDCLIHEKNLSLAAKQLNIPVSTASRHLHDLRHHFGDLLFSRCKEGMIPTQAALNIALKAQPVIEAYQKLLKPTDYDLKTVEKEVKIGCVDNAPFALFPNLYDALYAKAPDITLSFFSISNDRFNLLRHRDLDLIITPYEGELESDMHTLSIGINRYCVVASKHHPLAKDAPTEGWSDEALSPYPFVDVVFRPDMRNEYRLRDKCFPSWHQFRSGIKTQYFLPFIRSVARSDQLLMVIPEKSAYALLNNTDLVIIPTQTKGLSDEPKMVWHQLTHHDYVMQVVRSIIFSCSQEEQRNNLV